MAKRRRDPRDMGDATRQRIDDLAEGWDVSPSAEPAGAEPAGAESAGAESAGAESAGAPRPKRARKPPVPGARPKRARKPPPPPPGARPKRARKPPPPPPGGKAAPAPAADTVPTPRQELTIESESDAPADDATALQSDADIVALHSSTDGGTAHVRLPASLPRKRGLLGDVRYVLTAIQGMAGARRELAEVKTKLERERDERDDRLLHLARGVIGDPSVDLPIIESAREHLADVEDERSRKAGAAASAEAELESLTRERDSQREVDEATIAEREAERKQATEALAPLEKRAAAARRKADDLHVSLRDIDAKIANKKASANKIKGGSQDPAAIAADIASLRAERQDVEREEPAIAAELDELEPKIASLKVARKEALAAIDELKGIEAEAEISTREKLAAVRARKAVEDRSVSDADRKRDEALRAVGEKLCIDRPESMTVRLRPIDEHDVSIATLERRALDLEELVRGIDRAKLGRGIGVLVLAVVLVAGLIWLLFG